MGAVLTGSARPSLLVPTTTAEQDLTMPGRNREERGATAVEYALLVTLIAAMMVGAVLLFGDGVGGLFGDAQQSVEHVVGP